MHAETKEKVAGKYRGSPEKTRCLRVETSGRVSGDGGGVMKETLVLHGL